MRLVHLLPLAAVVGAFIIPDENVASQLVLQDDNSDVSSSEPLQSIDDYIYDAVFNPEDNISSFESSENVLDDALSFSSDSTETKNVRLCVKSMQKAMQGFDADAWLEEARNPYGALDFEGDFYDEEDNDEEYYDDEDFSTQEPPPPPSPHCKCSCPRRPPRCHRPRWGRHPPRRPPPHRRPPHPGPPHHCPPDELESHPPHRGHRPPHGHRPHHGHKSNLTIWQLISSSKYTTKLAKLVSEDAQLVETLNSTSTNITVFAPTDAAFEKIPKHHKKVPKELILKVLKYHTAHGLYPARKLFGAHTIPSNLKEDSLGGERQRLRISIGLGGLRINFRSRVIAANIFAANGVIHGINNIILLPPPALKIIDLVPGQFSTLSLGLLKTGLADDIEDSKHIGGTLFAPSNMAFKRLGPKINAFLFSKYGLKYLKALLEYHIVPDTTLYSDAIYKHESKNDTMTQDRPGRSIIHVDLPTLLSDRYLSIDIARWGRFITMKINGFSSVSVMDAIAKDGNIHVVPRVLIPPKTPGGKAEDFKEDELSVEELKERLSPLVRYSAGGEEL